MQYTNPQTRNGTKKVPPTIERLDWLVRLLLFLALTFLIIRGHGCHPGGHEDEIDEELVHKKFPPN